MLVDATIVEVGFEAQCAREQRRASGFQDMRRLMSRMSGKRDKTPKNFRRITAFTCIIIQYDLDKFTKGQNCMSTMIIGL